MLSPAGPLRAQEEGIRVPFAGQISHSGPLSSNAVDHLPVALRTAPTEAVSALTFGSPDSYRWEGAVIGFVIGGAALTYLGLRVCTDNCTVSAIGGFLGGGILGGFTGMLIGGLFPKDPPVRNQEGGTVE